MIKNTNGNVTTPITQEQQYQEKKQQKAQTAKQLIMTETIMRATTSWAKVKQRTF